MLALCSITKLSAPSPGAAPRWHGRPTLAWLPHVGMAAPRWHGRPTLAWLPHVGAARPMSAWPPHVSAARPTLAWPPHVSAARPMLASAPTLTLGLVSGFLSRWKLTPLFLFDARVLANSCCSRRLGIQMPELGPRPTPRTCGRCGAASGRSAPSPRSRGPQAQRQRRAQPPPKSSGQQLDPWRPLRPRAYRSPRMRALRGCASVNCYKT